jgi:hypothetical protein
VERELGRRHGHAPDLATPLQLAAERGMQTISLAVEQLVVGDLGEKRVPEDVAARSVVEAVGVDEDALGDRRPQCIGDSLRRHPEDRGQELLVDPSAGRGRRPQEPLRLVREAGQPGDQHVSKRWRERTARAVFAAVSARIERRRQLLDEERVAAAAVHHRVHARRRRRRGRQRPKQRRDLPTLEALQVYPFDPLVPLKLGDERQRRISPSKIVRAEGHEDQDGRLPQVPRKEPEEAARPVVRPLDVLDDQHHRAAPRLALDDTEDGFEEPRLAGPVEFEARGRVLGPRRDLGE